MKSQMDRKTFIMYVHTCHGILVEARGILKKLVLLPIMWVLGMELRSLGSKCLYLLSHFVGPTLVINASFHKHCVC